MAVGAITDDNLLIKGVKASIDVVPTVEQIEALLSNLPNSDEDRSQLNVFKNRDGDTFMHLLLEQMKLILQAKNSCQFNS